MILVRYAFVPDMVIILRLEVVRVVKFPERKFALPPVIFSLHIILVLLISKRDVGTA